MTGGSINKTIIHHKICRLHPHMYFPLPLQTRRRANKGTCNRNIGGGGGGGGSQDTESCIKDQLQHNYFIFGQSSKHPEMSRCPINRAHQVLS